VKSPQRDSVSDWPEAMKLSRFAGGNPHAPVTIIAAIDFECPACAAFHQTLQEVLAARRNDVQVRYMHWPLPYHRFALPAARAAECAAADGKFPAWADLMYKKRDSLGIESWGRFAAEAGIVDTARIARCATSPDPVAAIQAGTAFAKRAGGQGTPTVIISGWRFSSPPTRATLDSLLDAAVRSSHARS
jgi:protein-disulfide isomerase